MNYSASNIIKKSAKQLFYLSTHLKKVSAPSIEQVAGVRYQYNVTKSKYVEMGLFLTHNNNRVYFTFDEVMLSSKSAALIEHKMSLPDSPEWYFNSSIIQAAIYKALFLKSERKLATAKFYKEKTGDDLKLDLTKTPTVMLLHFGPKVYKIGLLNTSKLLKWFYLKIDSINDWDKARKFDEIYKHNEWKYLKDCISYVEV